MTLGEISMDVGSQEIKTYLSKGEAVITKAKSIAAFMYEYGNIGNIWPGGYETWETEVISYVGEDTVELLLGERYEYSGDLEYCRYNIPLSWFDMDLGQLAKKIDELNKHKDTRTKSTQLLELQQKADFLGYVLVKKGI